MEVVSQRGVKDLLLWRPAGIGSPDGEGIRNDAGAFPGSPVLPLQRPWVQSLVGELISHMPSSRAK